MDRPQATELIGANDSTVRLQGAAVETQVRVDRVAAQKVMRSFQTSATLSATPVEPDRIFLNLENIRGQNDAAIFYVYVNLPQDANPEEHPDRLAGVVSLFGVQNATRTDDAHAGNGINEVLEITEIVDALHSSGTVDLDHLSVRFVPRTDVRPEDDISVGRVSVYREGQ
jgi:tyrosinase